MKKKKKMSREQDDFISEQGFLEQLGRVPTTPDSDSPDDSEFDAGSEFLMGINYVPQKRSKRPGRPKDTRIHLPDAAKTVSSDRPDPWQDLDSDSATH